MQIATKSITDLPVAESVTNEDKLPVYKDGRAYSAAAALFRGDPATINGEPALTIQAGENVTLDQADGILTINAAGTAYSPATVSEDGLMSAADKGKLDGIAEGAQANVIEGVSVNGTTAPVSGKIAALTLDKATVGLGRVDNTPDTEKPVSTAQQTALNGKVDVVPGKGLSTNDYTTAEKDKLLGIEEGAQVNEVTLEQYRSLRGGINAIQVQNNINQKLLLNFRTVFHNFLYATGDPVYMSTVGTGVIDIEDAAAGQIHSISVDPSLSGQRLYIQLSNTTGLTDTTVTVNSDGVAFVSLATARGRNRLYVTTSAYVFPPNGSGGHNENTSGTYVNLHTDENGQMAYDYWLPQNSVEATVRYVQNVELGDMLAREISEDDFLATLGLYVTYAVTDNPAAMQSAGKKLYAKLDGYPFATMDKPVYAKTSYPNSHCKVFYVAEYHYL